MTAEEIFKEVLKSPDFQTEFGIPREKLENIDYNTESSYEQVEIIRAIIRGEFNNSDKSSVFRHIQNHIVKL